MLISGCTTTKNQIKSRETPEIISITQNEVREYIFCDPYKGAWSCDEYLNKTLVLEESKSLIEGKVKSAFFNIMFDFNNYELTDEYVSRLRKLAEDLQNKKILLMGFTDHVGTEKYNDSLALKRAKTVQEFLVSVGLKKDDINVEGHGLCCYLTLNNTDADRRINRRVEIHLLD